MKAVFLDRDGVLNKEVGYIHHVEDFQLNPGAAAAVAQLNQAGWFTALVSNQSGPSRGYYDLSHVDALHTRLTQLLHEEAEAHLDAIAYCPYLSPATGGTDRRYTRWSTWRKPNTGMYLAHSWRYNLTLSASYMVGDKATDIDMACNAGVKGILVTSGYGKQVLQGQYQHQVKAVHVAADLQAAVQWLLHQ
jgi:D-glycero-D-manno-heptose 1,7-bisphosphate phosphatase